jgi:hypothetical protein
MLRFVSKRVLNLKGECAHHHKGKFLPTLYFSHKEVNYSFVDIPFNQLVVIT